jgi:hypothetical protein
MNPNQSRLTTGIRLCAETSLSASTNREEGSHVGSRIRAHAADTGAPRVAMRLKSFARARENRLRHSAHDGAGMM